MMHLKIRTNLATGETKDSVDPLLGASQQPGPNATIFYFSIPTLNLEPPKKSYCRNRYGPVSKTVLLPPDCATSPPRSQLTTDESSEMTYVYIYTWYHTYICMSSSYICLVLMTYHSTLYPNFIHMRDINCPLSLKN